MNRDKSNAKKSEVTITFGKKATAIFMSTLLSAMLLAGCAGTTGTAKTNSDYKDQTIFGEVTKVTSDSITIEVGTMNRMKGQDVPSDDSGEDSSDGSIVTASTDTGTSDSSDTSGAAGDSKKSGLLTKTGDTATITVDEDTEITKRSMMGGPGMGRNGQNGPDGQNGQPPQGAPGQGNSGDSNSSSSDSGNANSGAPQGQPSEGAPGQGNSGESIELSDIEEGDTVSITIDENGETDKISVMSSDDMGNGGGSSAANVEYSAVKTYEEDADVDKETVESTGKDENGVLVKSGNVDFEDLTVTRESDESTGGDNASFYGVSAAVLGTGGTAFVSDSDITTDAEGGAGIFSYGDATVYASDSTIKTSKGASGGIHAAGGGTLYAWDLDVTTAGQSSAAIRSDRGGGKMVVDGGSYTSSGKGSPAIYSTADITVNDADLTAKGSEAICIEGKNSVRLFDSSLTGNMPDDSQNDCTWNVILYQSMSGDSEEGTSEFEMDGGEITAKNGGMFYTTNTSSKFVLKDVDITYADENDFFLKATGNSNQRGWGQSGSNGADCDFTAISQDMEGDVIWDKISTLDFYMTDGSTLTGAVVKDNSNAGSGKGGKCSVYIDKDSTWTVTGDSTVTNLYNAGTIKDASGKTVTIKGTDGKVYVKGTSKYTITVKTYSTDDKTDKADSISSWSDYKTEKPSEL